MSRAVRDGRAGAGRIARVVLGGLLVAASVAALGALTRFQYDGTGDRGELRLAWRMPVPRVVECREPTAEELAELPVHMRRDEICEGRAVEYRLEVRVDDELRHEATVAPEGARADRPMQIFHELPLEPGTRRVRVVFERTDGAAGEEADEAGEESPGPSGGATEAPVRLVLDRILEVAGRDVVLVTYDRDARTLRLRATGE